MEEPYFFENSKKDLKNQHKVAYNFALENQEYNRSWSWIMPVIDKIENLEEIDRNKSFDANGTAPRYCTPYRVDIINRNMVEILAFGEDLMSSADFLKPPKEDYMFGVVEFHRGCFMAVIVGDNGEKAASELDEDCIVMGNIHENPELL
jgi:hypothetical protein